MKKGITKVIGTVLLGALVFAGCGKGADAGTPGSTVGGTPEDAAGSAEGGAPDQPEEGADAGATPAGGTVSGQDSSATPTELPEDDAGAGEVSSAPQISFELLSDTRSDAAGNPLVTAQYPVFSVSGEGYEALAAVLAAWNGEFKEQAVSFLNAVQDDAAWYRESVDTAYQYGQKLQVTVTRCDRDFVSILIGREVEEGGPHPNYYSEALNFFAPTGILAKLADVVPVDDALQERINVGLHENYPDLEFDEELLRAGIADALVNETVEWYFTDGKLCISFPEGSFGFGHAEGSLGVILSDGEPGKGLAALEMQGAAVRVESGDDPVAYSPDGKKAKFVPVQGWGFPALEITLEDGTKKECELTDVFFSSPVDFCWINEEKLVFEGHVNPSLNTYIVYDLKENDFQEYFGVFFTWNHDCSKLFYVETSPHFGAEPVPEKIIDQDGDIYFETKQGEHLVNGLILDAADRNIGFYVRTEEEGEYFGMLDCETKAVVYEETGAAHGEG